MTFNKKYDTDGRYADKDGEELIHRTKAQNKEGFGTLFTVHRQTRNLEYFLYQAVRARACVFYDLVTLVDIASDFSHFTFLLDRHISDTGQNLKSYFIIYNNSYYYLHLLLYYYHRM